MDHNTEREQETVWDSRPVVSLHVDLPWTDLEDFAEHLERHIQFAADQLNRGLFANDPLLGNVLGYRIIWNKDVPLIDCQYIRVESVPFGRTRRMYFVTEDSTLLTEAYRVRFILFATRYRRDRLKIVLYERTTQGERRYADRLHDWLLERWGGDDDEMAIRSIESAPPMPEPMPEPMPLLPSRATEVEWFAWFDWYYRQPWGAEELSARLAHMAHLTGKSYPTVAAKHALYMDDKR